MGAIAGGGGAAAARGASNGGRAGDSVLGRRTATVRPRAAETAGVLAKRERAAGGEGVAIGSPGLRSATAAEWDHPRHALHAVARSEKAIAWAKRAIIGQAL